MKLSEKRYAPGPGVNKGEPPKTGAERFFDVVGSNFTAVVKINLLFCIAVFPSALIFVLFISGVIPAPNLLISFLALALSLAAAFPVGAAISASMYCIAKMLRDDLRWFWRDYRRKFRECFLQSAFPGIACTLFVYAQVFVYLVLLLSIIEANPDATWLDEDTVYLWSVVVAQVVQPGQMVASLSSILVLSMIAPYVFLQLAYIDLGVVQIIKNSALLAMSNIGRSVSGAIIGGLSWIATVLFLPYSVLATPLLALFGFSFSWLIQAMWVWPVLDKHFSISETLSKEE
jgi:hypothetical protein